MNQTHRILSYTCFALSIHEHPDNTLLGKIVADPLPLPV
jgi:hypothetical protein